MDRDCLKADHDAAVEEVHRRADAIEAAGTGADMKALDAALTEAEIEATRTQGNLDLADRVERAKAVYAGMDIHDAGDPPAYSLGDLKTYRHGQAMAEASSSVAGVPVRDLEVGRALRGIITGDWRGAEAEMRALNSTGSTAGLTLLPQPLSAQFIDYARAQSVVSEAGALTVAFPTEGGGIFTLAKCTADPTVSWVANAGTITPADPTLGKITMTARKAVVLTKISRELFNDAPNAERILTSILAGAVAAAIDKACLEGAGSGSAEILGLSGLDASGNGAINEVVFDVSGNGLTPSASSGPGKLVSAVKAIKQDNATPNAIISSPRTWGGFAALADTTNQPLRLPPAIDTMPWFTTTGISDARTRGTSNVSSNLYLGDWSQYLIAVNQEIEIYVTRDAYITTDEVAVLVTWRGDAAPLRDASFARVVGILE